MKRIKISAICLLIMVFKWLPKEMTKVKKCFSVRCLSGAQTTYGLRAKRTEENDQRNAHFHSVGPFTFDLTRQKFLCKWFFRRSTSFHTASASGFRTATTRFSTTDYQNGTRYWFGLFSRGNDSTRYSTFCSAWSLYASPLGVAPTSSLALYLKIYTDKVRVTNYES